MKTKFVRILSVLLAIAMLAACSVIVSATGSSLDSKLGLVGEYDENSKIVKISLVYSGEVCYNVEGNWGDILDENGNTADGFTLNNIEFNNAVVDGLNDMHVGNTITGNATWIDMKFDNTATSGTIMTAEYIVGDSVEPGEYTAVFNVLVYTGSDKIPQEDANGSWIANLSVDFVVEEDVQNVAVETKGTISYTVEGQVVTVTHTAPCKVGYLKDGKYVAITAEHVSGNTYKFTAPEGVTEVLIVVKGDADLNGKISVTDKSQVNAVALRKTTFGPEAVFAADINSNGRIDVTDKSQVNAVVLRKTTFAW